MRPEWLNYQLSLSGDVRKLLVLIYLNLLVLVAFRKGSFGRYKWKIIRGSHNRLCYATICDIEQDVWGHTWHTSEGKSTEHPKAHGQGHTLSTKCRQTGHRHSRLGMYACNY